MKKAPKKLSEEEVTEMLKQLEYHFNEPVLPLGNFCKTMTKWVYCIIQGIEEAENEDPKSVDLQQGHEYSSSLHKLLIDIQKSGLLLRMFYRKEDVRTEKCPYHKGHMATSMWALGITHESELRHDCLCEGSGWIPNELEKQEELVKWKEECRIQLEEDKKKKNAKL